MKMAPEDGVKSGQTASSKAVAVRVAMKGLPWVDKLWDFRG